MNIATKFLAIGMVSLFPLHAMAADANVQKVDATQPAGNSNLHGFDKYWSMMDPTGKGYVTKEEWMAHAADRFKEIDANGDGKITKEEMRAHDDKMREHYREMHAQHEGMVKAPEQK